MPRLGRRAYGVPPGGAFDQESLALLNALLGNEQGVPAIELGLGVLEAQVEDDFAIGLVGALAPVSLNAGQVEGPCRMIVQLKRGDQLKINAPTEGARVYIGAFGGWRGELNNGSRWVPGLRRDLPERRLAEAPASLYSGPIRVVLGPHASRFASDALAQTYRVGHLIDRMGLRIDGAPLPTTPEIVSEPCVPGTIQVTNDGSLLIHGPDGPTIGGYPKLAHVISADLDRIGHLAPGARLEFEVISVKTARELWRERCVRIAGTTRMLRILA